MNATQRIARMIAEKKAQLKPETIFSSPYYREYLQNIADTISGKYGRGAIVETAYDTSENASVAYTDGCSIHIIQYITLSYAITIHKSQGSEFKSVIIPLLKSYYIMLKRNLLYTAVTRAKSKVILVGERQAVYMAVNKTETDKRLTQLGKRI